MENSMERDVRGVLLDVDGVLQVSDAPLPGAVETLAWLRASAVPFRLLTNTAVRARATLAARLRESGLDVADDELLTAGYATAAWLRRRHAGRPVYLLGAGDVAADFAGIPLTDGDDAQLVVIGGAMEGAMEGFSYAALNRAFQLVRGGARLVAMHRNPWWPTAAGPQLDAGAWLRGLEFATGRRATVLGKPSAAFFRAGFRTLGLPPEHVLMVGDDLRQDVLPAMRLGAAGAVVRTGKFHEDDLRAGTPDAVLDGVAGVLGLLAGGVRGTPSPPAPPNRRPRPRQQRVRPSSRLEAPAAVGAALATGAADAARLRRDAAGSQA
jgi:HAD superfamily hydrolase (TIGR01458 family)